MTDFTGNFCNHCGQKSSTRRIDLNYLMNEVPNSVLQVNRGFFFTIKQLLLRPGYAIRDFLQGKRRNYYKPVAFLIVTTTMYVLATYVMDRNTFFADIMLGMEEGANDSGKELDYSIIKLLSKNEVYLMLLVLPVFSLASFIAFFRSEYNYFEHLVANLFITGQQMLIYFVSSFIFFEDNIFSGVPLLLGIAYNFWSFSQLFDEKKSWTTFGLILLTYFLFILFTVLVTGFVAMFYR